MNTMVPYYHLYTECRIVEQDSWERGDRLTGRWRFTLEAVRGESRLEASGEEDESEADRLSLLAVVRGLEALDRPARVILFTRSKYVSRGLRFGLAEWRETDWCWERFGEMVPVANADLWQRVDRALRYHDVECRIWRLDQARPSVPAPKLARHRHRRRGAVESGMQAIGSFDEAPLREMWVADEEPRGSSGALRREGPRRWRLSSQGSRRIQTA